MLKIDKSELYGLLRKGVIKNILTVGIITLLLKGIGFFKEALIAASFGLSELLDTFLIAFLIPGFIYNVFISSFKSVFIPNYVNEQRRSGDLGGFQSTIFVLIGLVSIFFTIVAYLFTDLYLAYFFPGHSDSYYDLIKHQFHFILPCILVWGASSILNGLLNIKEEFRHSSFSGVFTPIAIIICLLFFKESLGKTVLAFGTLMGAVLSLIYLIIICTWRKVLIMGMPNFRNYSFKVMFFQMPAKISSSFLASMHNVVDQYFAAQLIVGSISALSYGQKIPAFVIGITVIAITNVLLPYFSKLVIDNKALAFKNLFKSLKFVFIVTSIIAFLGILTSEFFVGLFFERNEFTSDDTQTVARIQQIILIYIPFKISGMLLVNFLTSINKNNYMAYVSFISIVLNVILDMILMKIYGVYGIALATTFVVVLRNILLFTFTIKQRKIQLNV